MIIIMAEIGVLKASKLEGITIKKTESSITESIQSISDTEGQIHLSNILNWENDKSPTQQTFENIICENSIKQLCVNRDHSKIHNHVFSHTVTPRLPITDFITGTTFLTPTFRDKSL